MRDVHGRIDIQAITQAITTIIEGWVREHSEQWLCYTDAGANSLTGAIFLLRTPTPDQVQYLPLIDAIICSNGASPILIVDVAHSLLLDIVIP
jgi:hypothetical protein